MGEIFSLKTRQLFFEGKIDLKFSPENLVPVRRGAKKTIPCGMGLSCLPFCPSIHEEFKKAIR